MNNLSVNIGIEEILNQREVETSAMKPKTVFNEKNYLNVRLLPGEKSKEVVIRLLPFSPEGGTPFKKIYAHTVKVNKEVSPGGWKTMPCPKKNGVSDRCPFCETAEQAKELKFQAFDESEKKKYDEVEYANKHKECWVVRCIERGHEEDGVKFWMFSHNKKGDGIYDKIMNVFQTRYNKAIQQGKISNIFDLTEGKDLVIRVTKDSMNKSVYQITDDDEKTPLSTDPEKANAWINDSKKWDEVYTFKSFDYMSVLVKGGVPYYSKELNKYINKEEMQAQAEAEIEANLTSYALDMSSVPNAEAVQVFGEVTKSPSTEVDDDLPF